MKVRELIKHLELAPNKDVEVYVYHDDYDDILEINHIDLCISDRVDINACFNAGRKDEENENG